MESDRLKVDHHTVLVKTLPIGIGPFDFRKRLRKDKLQHLVQSTRQKFEPIDADHELNSVDYIKGIPLKLHAMDMCFQQHPKQIGRVALVQVVTPSREDLEANQKLRREIPELGGKINGKDINLSYAPFHFLYKSLQPDELTALCAAADVCFTCNTRDGLNLVCCEYVACLDRKDIEQTTAGVLVFSEFAGASTTLAA